MQSAACINRDQVLSVVTAAPQTTRAIEQALSGKMSDRTVRTWLKRLADDGALGQPRWGYWALRHREVDKQKHICHIAPTSHRESVVDGKYSEAKAAEKLGVSTRTLQRWRKAGKLPFIRAGLFIWYTDQMLEEFLRRSTHNA